MDVTMPDALLPVCSMISHAGASRFAIQLLLGMHLHAYSVQTLIHKNQVYPVQQPYPLCHKAQQMHRQYTA